MLSEPNSETRGASVFNDPALSKRAKVMYGVMLKYADVNGTFTVSHTTLMQDIGAMTKRTVALATKELADNGILSRQRKSASVRYKLLK
jgi:Helix-turn-helix domain